MAAILSLTGRIGSGRTVLGRVETCIPLSQSAVEIHIDPGPDWPGHRSGQFARFTFDSREGAHPFTIASGWTGERRLVIAVKALGDFTTTMVQRLAPGAPVRIEGPFGQFDFSDGERDQVWIAGGVGLTPFLARMETLALENRQKHEPSPSVTLFFSTQNAAPALVERIQAVAEAADIRLRIIDTGKNPLFKPEDIPAEVPDWSDASYWFCGPPGMGDAVFGYLAGRGIPKARLHREAFQFR
jgi:predicted ferric reductase